jgi:hypothetical protein
VESEDREQKSIVAEVARFPALSVSDGQLTANCTGNEGIVVERKKWARTVKDSLLGLASVGFTSGSLEVTETFG